MKEEKFVKGKQEINETRVDIKSKSLHWFFKCLQCIFILIKTFVHSDKQDKHMT